MQKMSNAPPIYQLLDPPYGPFDNAMLGAQFALELASVSRLWLACGYRPGIAAYLNLFLLRDFILSHDAAFPPRFQSFRSMARSFYRTDLFVRDMTDSGRRPMGGISSQTVRATLHGIMRRHQRIAIPHWMMRYFGFRLLEMVEKEHGGLTAEGKQRHLSYMTRTYRIMGLAFSERRARMEQFSREVEARHAGISPHLGKHARHILFLGRIFPPKIARLPASRVRS